MSCLLFWIGAWDGLETWMSTRADDPSWQWPLVFAIVGGAGSPLVLWVSDYLNAEHLTVKIKADDELGSEAADVAARPLSESLSFASRLGKAFSTMATGAAGTSNTTPLHCAGQLFSNSTDCGSCSESLLHAGTAKPLKMRSFFCCESVVPASPSPRCVWMLKSFVGFLHLIFDVLLFVGIWDLIDYEVLVQLLPENSESKLYVALLGLVCLFATGGLTAYAHDTGFVHSV